MVFFDLFQNPIRGKVVQNDSLVVTLPPAPREFMFHHSKNQSEMERINLELLKLSIIPG
jgi:hypothetical protein